MQEAGRCPLVRGGRGRYQTLPNARDDLWSTDPAVCRTIWATYVGGPLATTGKVWGGSSYGGDAGSVDLTDLVDISCGGYACVARKSDGTGVAWGDSDKGGDASSVDLTDLVDISCGFSACVARKSDGTGLAWGDSANGGDASSVDLTNLVDISCGGYACVAR